MWKVTLTSCEISPDNDGWLKKYMRGYHKEQKDNFEYVRASDAREILKKALRDIYFL